METIVKYIEHRGEKYPYRISYSALKAILENLDSLPENKGKEEGVDISMDDLANGKMAISVYETMLFKALQSGAFAEGTDMPFKKEQMEFLLDSCFEEFIDSIKTFIPKLGKMMPQNLQQPLENQAEEKS